DQANRYKELLEHAKFTPVWLEEQTSVSFRVAYGKFATHRQALESMLVLKRNQILPSGVWWGASVHINLLPHGIQRLEIDQPLPETQQFVSPREGTALSGFWGNLLLFCGDWLAQFNHGTEFYSLYPGSWIGVDEDEYASWHKNDSRLVFSML